MASALPAQAPLDQRLVEVALEILASEGPEGLTLRRLARDPWGDGSRQSTPILTHQQIADMIGTSRETVTRVVKELKQEEWLEQEGKKYLVPVS